MASYMVDHDSGRVVVFNIAPPGTPTQDVDAFLDETVPKINAPRSLFEPKYAIAQGPF